MSKRSDPKVDAAAAAASAAAASANVVKIWSHSAQYGSFWTLQLTPNTRTIDILQTIAKKINTEPEDLGLYEVGSNQGLVFERKMGNDELVQPLKIQWDLDKSTKKFSIALERKPANRVPGGHGPLLSETKERPLSTPNLSSRISESKTSQRPLSHEFTSDAPPSAAMSVLDQLQRGSNSSPSLGSLPPGAQSFVVEELHPVRSVQGQRAVILPVGSAPASPQIIHMTPANASSSTSTNNNTAPPSIAVSPPPSRLSGTFGSASTSTTVPNAGPVLLGRATSAVELSATSRNASPALSSPSRARGYVDGSGRPSSPLVNSSSAFGADPIPAPAVFVNDLYIQQQFADLKRTATPLLEAIDLSSIGNAQLVVSSEIQTQSEALFMTAFAKTTVGALSTYQLLSAILIQGGDIAKEAALRLITNLTLQAENQLRISQSTLTAAIVRLLVSSTQSVRTLAAWSLANLSVAEIFKERVRELNGIQGLTIVLHDNDVAGSEHSLRAFCNILAKGQDANKAIFVKNAGIPVLVEVIARKDATEAIVGLGLKVLMLLPYHAETKSTLLRAGGLSPLVRMLASPREQNRQYAAWIISNLVVDGTINDDVRKLGGIPPLVKLLSDINPFVREQATTIIANLAVNEVNLDHIREAGGLRALIVLLQERNMTDSMRLKLVWALSNLLISEDNQVAFCEAGGAPLLVPNLDHSLIKVQVRTAAAIVNATQWNDVSRAEFGAKGGIEALMHALENTTDPELEEFVLKCFVNLSLYHLNEERLMQYGALDVLVAKLASNSPTRIRELAAHAIANLALNERVRNRLGETNGLVPVMVLYLQPPSEEAKVQALKAITNLSINGRNRLVMVRKGLLPRVQTTAVSATTPQEKEAAEMAVANLSFPVDEHAEEAKPVNAFVEQIVNERRTQASRQTEAGNVPYDGRPELQPAFVAPRKSTVPRSFTAQREEAELELRSLQREREDYLLRLQREKEERDRELEKAQRAVLEAMQKTAAEQAAAANATPESVEELAKRRQTEVDARAAKEVARVEKRSRIAAEMLVTERTYVDSMLIMINKYMKPMQSATQMKKPPVTPDEVKRVFSIAEFIYSFHSMFVEELEKRVMHWTETTQIGDIFLRMGDFLRNYTQYVNNYDTAIQLLDELEKRPLFAQLLQKLTNDDTLKGLSLYSYLIMPIQRPPRYELLLTDLLKNTSETHSDYDNLKKALQLIIDINNEVDLKKKQADDKKKVLEVAQAVVGMPRDEDLVAAHRIFVREGDLQSGIAEHQQSFHVLLFNDILVVTRPVASPARRASFTGNMPTASSTKQYEFITKLYLKDCTLSEPPAALEIADVSFKVGTSSNYSLLLICSSPEQKTEWKTAIQEHINQCLKQKQAEMKARLSMRTINNMLLQ